MQKKVIVFLILSFVSVFLFMNFISAAITCSVKTSCDVGSEVRVMGLTATTNAHGQLANQSGYAYSLCCTLPAGYGLEGINTTCINNNKILGLSSQTNAHAEGPVGNYTNNVCYGDLGCELYSNQCPSNYNISMLSLSNTTNAHLGAFASYTTKICCKSSAGFIGSNCNLDDATWQVPTITKGLPAPMTVNGTGCFQQGFGAVINFSIYKDNSVGADTYIGSVLGNYPSAAWPALQGTDYYFIATATISKDQFSGLNGTGYDKLTVTAQPNPNPCGSMDTCESYTTFGTSSDSKIVCNADYCARAPGDPRIDSTPPADYSYGCAWNNATSTCNFTENYGSAPSSKLLCGNGQTLCYNPTSDLKYCYADNTCPAGHQVLSDGNGVCDVGEGCSSVECLNNNQDSCVVGTKCKKGTNSSNEGMCYSTGPKVNDTACKSKYTLCHNTAGNLNFCFAPGPGETCPAGSVPAAGSCASTSPDSSATCVGNNAICQSGVCSDTSVSVGKCTYSYINTGDTCADDGLLTYQWTASWSGTGSVPSTCTDGSATIECPAQIPLPLFTPVNAIITIIAIIGIYAIIILVKKSHKGKKHHGRKH